MWSFDKLNLPKWVSLVTNKMFKNANENPLHSDITYTTVQKLWYLEMSLFNKKLIL